MSINKFHTPGKWRVVGGPAVRSYWVKGGAADSPAICQVEDDKQRSPVETASNVSLISMAPELKQALDDIHAAMDGSEWDSDTLDEIAGILYRIGYQIDEVRS